MLQLYDSASGSVVEAVPAGAAVLMIGTTVPMLSTCVLMLQLYDSASGSVVEAVPAGAAVAVLACAGAA